MKIIFGTIIKREKNILMALDDEGTALLFVLPEQHMQSIVKPTQLQHPLSIPILSTQDPS